MSRNARGFTLLEVLIAVLVLALALVALVRTAANQIDAFGRLRERTLAGWVAQNILAETRITQAFPQSGRSDGSRRLAGRDWRWELKVEATEVPTIRRLDVRVFAAADRSTALAELTGFSGLELQP
ncbi:MAG TPA: type II secretion system minor pseudopilin GspI [Rudaea sp.]